MGAGNREKTSTEGSNTSKPPVGKVMPEQQVPCSRFRAQKLGACTLCAKKLKHH